MGERERERGMGCKKKGRKEGTNESPPGKFIRGHFPTIDPLSSLSNLARATCPIRPGPPRFSEELLRTTVTALLISKSTIPVPGECRTEYRMGRRTVDEIFLFFRILHSSCCCRSPVSIWDGMGRAKEERVAGKPIDRSRSIAMDNDHDHDHDDNHYDG